MATATVSKPFAGGNVYKFTGDVTTPANGKVWDGVKRVLGIFLDADATVYVVTDENFAR